MEGLLNLENLSQEEKDKILSVINKDEMVRKTEDKKICQLKSDIQAIRMKSVLRAGDDLSKICARCHSELGMFFNRGDVCPKCHFRVCNICKENTFKGQWLCILCYKQRQLKWFVGDWDPGKPTRWPSGADLVKASIYKIAVHKGSETGSDSEASNKDDKKRGKIHNGSLQQTRSDRKQTVDRVEFPQNSDQKKLNQLFETFNVPRHGKDSGGRQHTIKRISTKKYQDSDSETDSSVSTEQETESTIKSNRNTDSFKTVTEELSDQVTKEGGAKLQRNYSDDSDQTLLSDDVPFSKSSTETQIKVDIHSDEDCSISPLTNGKSEHSVVDRTDPQESEDKVNQKIPRSRMKQSATEVIMAMKLSSLHSSSQKSQTNQIHPNNSRHPDPKQYQPGRSPSPYSFDSIPSSHANSPLPNKRLSDCAAESYISKESSDTDSMSRFSAADNSGTESSVIRESSSGADEYVVEELSKIRFRRMNKKSQEQKKTSIPSPPPDLSGVVREGQSSQIPPICHPLNNPSTIKSGSFSDTSLSFMTVNISTDLSLDDIEQDCMMNPEIYDITDLARVSRAMLKIPETELALKGKNKSPKSKRKEKEMIVTDGVKSVESSMDSDIAKNALKEDTVDSVDPVITDAKKDTLQKKLIKFEPIVADSCLTDKESGKDEQLSQRKVIKYQAVSENEFTIDDVEGEKFDLAISEQMSQTENTNLDVSGHNTNMIITENKPESVNVAIGTSQVTDNIDLFTETNVEKTDTVSTQSNNKKLTMNDSGRHDSFDSLLESSLFQTHRLSSVDDRMNRFGSVDSFNLSPFDPISDSQVEMKSNVYTFAFDNSSILRNGSAREKDEFEEIFTRAVNDLETPSEDKRPTSRHKKRTSRSSVQSQQELSEQVEINPPLDIVGDDGMEKVKGFGNNGRPEVEVEQIEGDISNTVSWYDVEPIEDLKNSILSEIAVEHGFRFSMEDQTSFSQNNLATEEETLKVTLQKLQDSSEDHSLLWHYEDDSIEENYNQLFGSADSFVKNRESLRKTLVGSADSNSTESDGLSIIQEEQEVSDLSTEDKEDKLGGIDEQPYNCNKLQNFDFVEQSQICEKQPLDKEFEVISEQNIEFVEQQLNIHEQCKVSSEHTSNLKQPEVCDEGRLYENESATNFNHEKETGIVKVTIQKTEKMNEVIDVPYDKGGDDNLEEDKLNEESGDGYIICDKVEDLIIDPPKEFVSNDTNSLHNNLFQKQHPSIGSVETETLSRKTGPEQISTVLTDSYSSELNIHQESLSHPEITDKNEKERRALDSLSSMLLASSQIALATTETSDNKCERSEASTRQLVSSLEADICLDSHDISFHNESANSSETVTKDVSPESHNEKQRKRNKSKQLVEEWLESEVIKDSDISSDQHISEWLQKEVSPSESVEYNPKSALTLPLPPKDQQLADDTYPTVATKIPILKLEEITEKRDTGATRLSPRASSEGSGSLEDSGHVSGASTENTPEHRRTDSMLSQLSVPSTLSTVTDRSSEETDIDDAVASHKSYSGSNRGNLLSTIADSRESILSIYSNAGEVDYGKIPVTGEIMFGLEYNYRTGTLEILIKRCRDLAPADTKRNRSDPYVKTYLLPDKTRGGKRKTRIQKNTLNPVFDQPLRYLISKSELENRTLWVTVWHNDRFGRNDFLGEVTINFDYFRFSDSSAKWYPLQERIESHPAANLAYKGDLFLSIKFVPPEKVKKEDIAVATSKKKIKKGKTESGSQKGQLHVLIKEARNLTAVRSSGNSDPFVKGYLLPDKHRGLKQKTAVIRRNCNPQWDHTFVFDDITKADLSERCLELTVWDYDKLTSNEFLGGLRLNQGLGRSYGKAVDWMDAHGEEISLWQAMMDRPNIWIDGALMLRPNMDKRKF